MQLDKDILFKNNKIYSPQNCIFVPRVINMLFVKSNKIRGVYPIGVSYNKTNNKYVAHCNAQNSTIHLGTYSTSQEAFVVYKKHKEQKIKDIANKFKLKIPKQLYSALVNYEVEITD